MKVRESEVIARNVTADGDPIRRALLLGVLDRRVRHKPHLVPPPPSIVRAPDCSSPTRSSYLLIVPEASMIVLHHLCTSFVLSESW